MNKERRTIVLWAILPALTVFILCWCSTAALFTVGQIGACPTQDLLSGRYWQECVWGEVIGEPTLLLPLVVISLVTLLIGLLIGLYQAGKIGQRR